MIDESWRCFVDCVDVNGKLWCVGCGGWLLVVLDECVVLFFGFVVLVFLFVCCCVSVLGCICLILSKVWVICWDVVCSKDWCEGSGCGSCVGGGFWFIDELVCMCCIWFYMVGCVCRIFCMVGVLYLLVVFCWVKFVWLIVVFYLLYVCWCGDWNWCWFYVW